MPASIMDALQIVSFIYIPRLQPHTREKSTRGLFINEVSF